MIKYRKIRFRGEKRFSQTDENREFGSARPRSCTLNLLSCAAVIVSYRRQNRVWPLTHILLAYQQTVFREADVSDNDALRVLYRLVFLSLFIHFTSQVHKHELGNLEEIQLLSSNSHYSPFLVPILLIVFPIGFINSREENYSYKPIIFHY